MEKVMDTWLSLVVLLFFPFCVAMSRRPMSLALLQHVMYPAKKSLAHPVHVMFNAGEEKDDEARRRHEEL